MFVDASGGMDRYDCRVFRLLTHSTAGGLPLGCVITTSESREAITLGLSLYNTITPPNAFFVRGSKGSEVFLRDDSESERQSLHDGYPNAVLVLCIFHLLQAAWQFIWEGRNIVKKDDRPHLLSLLKTLVYASSSDELEKYGILCNDKAVQKYPKYLEYCYCKKQYGRRELWAVCYRSHLPMRGTTQRTLSNQR